MAIFSRIRRASKAAEERGIVTVIEPVQTPPPPPTRPAPAPPIDPTKPAHVESPVVVTPEEVRSRIAANRKRQSEIIRRSAALSYARSHAHAHSRTVSEHSLPGSGWQTHRSRESTSIEGILQGIPIYDTELLPRPLVLRGSPQRESARGVIEHVLPRRHSEEFHAYSNPRAVPLPPPTKSQPQPPPRSRSRRLTKTKPNSLLPPAAVHREEEYFSSSSHDYSRHSASTTDSVASSATSASSLFNEQAEPKPSPSSLPTPNFSKPTKSSKKEKEKPALEISLPYNSDADADAEQIKTAKSLIPTWRYEDLGVANQLPTPVTTISAAHVRNQSWGQGYGHSRKTSLGTMFRRKNASVTGF